MSGYKIDLHTHSTVSPDGSLTERHYKKALQTGLLDYIAVTDHNTISFATQLKAVLGECIIVGEEITTSEGEIIGLFLQEAVPPHLSAVETVARIKAQKGLVYIPHPFEIVRQGMSMEHLNKIAEHIDIIEVHNGRALFWNTTEAAKEWSVQRMVPGAASSDSHGWGGWGRTYAVVSTEPTRANLTKLLHEATYETRWPGVRGVLYPKWNRLMKKVGNG